MAVLLGVFLLLAACAGEDEPAGSDTPADTEGGEPGALSVSAVDNSFEPASLSAPSGSEVTVEVTNDGSNPHTFTIDDLADTSTIAAGETASASFTMPDESVTFYCTIHGEDAMSGTIEPS
ncbi:MAG TPA: cupredoxin domain-containing protein [Actinomycetota bacterium]|nr:cupredoxin domain-containing protein [Actinomycetota bacterium]